jgi:sterol O-acyltransferase
VLTNRCAPPRPFSVPGAGQRPLVDTYVTQPENISTDVAVLVLTDVLGHRFINSQLVADKFAAEGFVTVMPDLFHGDAVPSVLPEGFPPFEKWLNGPPSHLADTVDPIVTAVIREMRTRLGCKQILAAGCKFTRSKSHFGR